MALPSSRPFTPSTPSAISFSPLRIAVHEVLGDRSCGLRPPLERGSSHSQVSTFANDSGLVCSTSVTLLRVRKKVILPPSSTSLPRSPANSRRLVPGASPVVVMKWPIMPLGYSRMAIHLVLDLDGVALGDRGDGRDAAGHHAAEQPLDLVEVVRALVQQHAAALALPGARQPPEA